MSPSAAPQLKAQPVLLIDAVVWPPTTPAADPRRDVPRWYARWLADLAGVTLRTASATDDVLGQLDHGVRAVILSGSPRDAWSDDPINARLLEVIQACRSRAVPFLGVCYGHQLLARALGGPVGRHPAGLELGNIDIELTPAGRAAPLFAGLPARFGVLSSHADAVLELPAGCELLAQGRHTLIQAFHREQRYFGVQFHPETDPETLRFIWEPRRATWRTRVGFDLDHVLDHLAPTPWAAAILRNFVTYYIA